MNLNNKILAKFLHMMLSWFSLSFTTRTVQKKVHHIILE